MVTEQDTEIFLAELVNALPDQVIWMRAIRDETGQIVNFRVDYSNQSSAEPAQIPYPLLVGTVVFQNDQLFDSSEETYFQELCTLVDTGQPREATYLDQDGSIRYVVTRKRVADGVLAILQDQSKQKATAYLQSVIDFAQAGICVISPLVDKDGVIVDFRFQAINRMVARLLDKTPDQLRGEVVSDWFTSYRETGTFERFKQTYETGKPQRYEINYNVDGFDVWFDVQCVRQENDVLVTFTDFTQLKQAQQSIEWQSNQNKQQAKLLNSILDSSDSGIMAFEAIRDPKQHDLIVDFRFVMANQACVTIVGKSLKQMIGRTMLRVFPGNRESGLFDGYVKTTETGEPFRTETYYKYDGLDFWLVVSAQKLGDGFVVTFNDVSGFRRLQQELENSVADLKRSNENLQQFAYVASHDLQEPLRKIQAFGDMLKSMYGEPLGDGADIINRMQAAAGRMSSLIRDLLTYSSLSTYTDTMRPLNLADVLNLVMENLELPIAESNATIHIGDLPMVLGDGFQLEQLIQNLLSNALKFKRPDSTSVIYIDAKTIDYNDLPVDVKPLRRAVSYHVISVSDNGIGFDDRYRNRIFQVFQRLHGKLQYAGTGIGLAIVQKVADNHGGAVSAHAKSGEGATFTVYLPK